MKRVFILFIGTLMMISCQKEEVTPLHFFGLMEVPEGLPAVQSPTDNTFTPERWALGKKLFYDPIMSSDSSVSCASCHAPQLAFSDDKAVSTGVQNRLGKRNSPTLANVAYHPYFTREGGVPTLEMQILVPIQEHDEFDFNILLIAERLKNSPAYTQMAENAYNRQPDAFVITRALACFERSLISGYSRYDQLVHYGKNALNESEQRGMELFFSSITNCSDCHAGFNFTNYAFENNGLYEDYEDEGRFRLTQNELDIARFKVPTLRNIELTAPYMHDGSLATLEDVVEHYNTGGKNHQHQSHLVRPLGLSKREKRDLVAFLRSLTDEHFVQNPIFRE